MSQLQGLSHNMDKLCPKMAKFEIKKILKNIWKPKKTSVIFAAD